MEIDYIGTITIIIINILYKKIDEINKKQLIQSLKTKIEIKNIKIKELNNNMKEIISILEQLKKEKKKEVFFSFSF